MNMNSDDVIVIVLGVIFALGIALVVATCSGYAS